MRKVWMSLMAVALMSVSLPVLAEYPVDCLGLNEPSGSDCMGINDIGCCDDQGRVTWCDGGQLYCIDCAELNPECGWSADAGFYDCGSDGSADPSGDNPKDCVGCDPPCGEGEICVNGVCEVCTPDCTGKQCGSDGCGGSCGECGGECVEGICHMGPGCEPSDGPGCGGCPCEACVCELDSYCCETAWDSICVGECINDCGGCPALENCGDGECVAEDFENCSTCPDDCACGEGETCFQGTCCTASCDGKECGDDGCGGSCGDCEAGFECSEAGLCEALPTCEMIAEISCQDVVEGDTTGHESLIDSYNCQGWDESGPEVGYMFVPEVDDFVIITLELPEEGADLDVFLLEGACTKMDCVVGGNLEIEAEVTAGTTYYIVVDGFDGVAGTYTLSVNCMSQCVPDCTGGPCTDDGCQGICPCDSEDDVCYDGACCTPSCEGKECGDDGCGGMNCGECEEGVCFDGQCQSGPGCVASDTPGCGGCPCEACVCELDDYCCSTAWDDICVGECVNECGGCPALENCGDGTCNPDEFENCSNCAEDCTCEEGSTCYNGECCTPSCDGKVCGSDGCGGSCGDCDDGLSCVEGECVESDWPVECLGLNEPSGDDCMGLTYEGCCDPSGRVMWCDGGMLYCIDCAAGNPECGWQGEFYDCGTDGSADPSGAFPKECAGCEPSCDGKLCGDDGCGGSCGDCPVGETCEAGACVPCEPNCDGLECGDDGCGGTCGDCAEGALCHEGLCHAGPGCEASGEPGCGGCDCEACVCEIDDYCCATEWDAVCVEICLNDCGGCPGGGVEEVCGNGTCAGDENCETCPDDCGCDAGFVCEEGACVEETCEPNCEGLECGDDGCGGSCGECADGFNCVAGLCEEAAVEPDVTEEPGDVVAGDTTGGEDTTGGGEGETKKEESGCTAAGTGNPMTALLFLALALGLAVIRRVRFEV